MKPTASSEDVGALSLRLLFPADDGTIARAIFANSGLEGQIVDEWRALCARSFVTVGALSEELFSEIFVDGLRTALSCLARGDVEGMIARAPSVGERLAAAGVPLASYVASLNCLKQSYAKALSGHPDLVNVLQHVEMVHSTLVIVVADGYYRALARADCAPGPEQLDPIAPSDPPTFHGIVGESAPMRRLFAKITRIAAHTSPVLVLGETGTGKELVARAIHQESQRRHGPFLAINCAALPRELVESELFGHRKGAFSGATSDALGLFRAASGGTLLLDEITEMPTDLQAKLLRVLQERALRPVGRVQEVAIDVRVVAASNLDPDVAMADGRLRADLFYRLSANTIVVPPLRSRLEDVELLAEHQLRLLAGRHGRHRELGDDALRCLRGRRWRGNVRELFNVIEQAFVDSEDAEIDAAALSPAASFVDGCADATAGSVATTLSDAERALVERTLASNSGNKRRTARQLGIARSTLYSVLERHGLHSTTGLRGSRPRSATGTGRRP